jgi:hypothetical protein
MGARCCWRLHVEHVRLRSPDLRGVPAEEHGARQQLGPRRSRAGRPQQARGRRRLSDAPPGGEAPAASGGGRPPRCGGCSVQRRPPVGPRRGQACPRTVLPQDSGGPVFLITTPRPRCRGSPPSRRQPKRRTSRGGVWSAGRRAAKPTRADSSLVGHGGRVHHPLSADRASPAVRLADAVLGRRGHRTGGPARLAVTIVPRRAHLVRDCTALAGQPLPASCRQVSIPSRYPPTG